MPVEIVKNELYGTVIRFESPFYKYAPRLLSNYYYRHRTERKLSRRLSASMELMEFHGTFLRLFRDFEQRLLVHLEINRYRINDFYSTTSN